MDSGRQQRPHRWVIIMSLCHNPDTGIAVGSSRNCGVWLTENSDISEKWLLLPVTTWGWVTTVMFTTGACLKLLQYIHLILCRTSFCALGALSQMLTTTLHPRLQQERYSIPQSCHIRGSGLVANRSLDEPVENPNGGFLTGSASKPGAQIAASQFLCSCKPCLICMGSFIRHS